MNNSVRSNVSGAILCTGKCLSFCQFSSWCRRASCWTLQYRSRSTFAKWRVVGEVGLEPWDPMGHIYYGSMQLSCYLVSASRRSLLFHRGDTSRGRTDLKGKRRFHSFRRSIIIVPIYAMKTRSFVFLVRTASLKNVARTKERAQLIKEKNRACQRDESFCIIHAKDILFQSNSD